MNYRHIYHAGNFGDVFKHILLIDIIRSLCRKEKPFAVLDTHAGAGIYDLQAPEARKKSEFVGGLAKIMGATDAPEPVARYLKIVRDFDTSETPRRNSPASLDPSEHHPDAPRCYPGSPALVAAVARKNDRLILVEKQPAVAAELRRGLKRDTRAVVHEMDGYNAVKAFVPPTEARGMVLIDPPYEQEGEYEKIYQSLEIGMRRWRQGTFCVWYPIKEPGAHEALMDRVRESRWSEACRVEIRVRPAVDVKSLVGCGLLVVNPPWGFSDTVKSVCPWLINRLAHPGSGRWSLERLS